MFGNHKDKEPIVTITEIRGILNKLNSLFYEKNWNSCGENNYSIRIEDVKLPNKGTNGKGVSHDFALASAYGELMERLQNGNVYNRTYGLKTSPIFKHKDELKIKKKEYLEHNESFLEKSNLKNRITKYYKNYTEFTCVPFYDATNDKEVYLPIGYLDRSLTSNGMCAGNTYEEALVQGIGEIFERTVRKEIYFGNSDFPIIPKKAYKALSVNSIIKDYEKKGFIITVKDLTLKGKFPVLGVIAYNKEKTKCKIAVAADSTFETTLQRCLTEMTQGRTLENLEHNMTRIDYRSVFCKKKIDEKELIENYTDNITKSNGIIPINFIVDNPEFSEVNLDVFLEDSCSNFNSLKHFYEIIKINNLNLLIRDVSFLEFPAFRIFIPEISDIWFTDYTLPENSKRLDYLFDIKKLAKPQLQELASYLEGRISDPILKITNKNFENIVSTLILKRKSDLNDLDFEILLVLIFIKLENYDKAYCYLKSYLDNNKNIKNLNYYYCTLLILKMKSEKKNKNAIKNYSKTIFGESIANEVISDLNKPEDSFKYYKLPTCPNCDTCEIKEICLYEEWKLKIEKLNYYSNTNWPDPEKLKTIIKRVV